MPRLALRLSPIPRFVFWWLRTFDRLRQGSTVAKVGSPDLHQAKMRFLVLAGCVAYGVSIGIFEDGLTRTQALIFGIGAVLFGLFALYTHAYFKRDPQPNFPRRTIGLFADHAAALACLAITGRDAGALAWLPLFIIQGVGIRFGVRWLFASQAIGVVSVGAIWAVNPFFRENATVGLGAILSVLVLPLYFALLANREARIKDALERARLDAEAANEAKGRFVAMISHELRTPLTGISGLNELLRKQGLPPNIQQMLAEQHAATSLMLTMVNDVLDLSKIEDGRMQLQEVDFDPQELALSVLRALSFQAERKGLAVHIELDASLPVALRGSPFHVSRILQNLLGNAIKFTSEGSITLRVKRGDDAPSGKGALNVQFEVIDTGIGIPEAALPKIFDRFYQVDAAVTRRFGGTGLGTSLVKEFCDSLQGSVRLESKLGEGTRCLVSLPFRRSQDAGRGAAIDVNGATVAAWTEGIAEWPKVEAQVREAGALVCHVNACHPITCVLEQDLDPPDVLLFASPPSATTLSAIAAMGLTDAACILLGDANQPELPCRQASSRVVTGARSDGFIARALQLATFGTSARQVGALAPTAKRRQSPASAQAALRVLIAEDTPTIQLVMRVTLESAGFSVTVTGDGAEALREAMSKHYDVVVLDWNMPKIDGIGVLRSLRSKPGPNSLTPIVIATAAPSQQLIDQAVDAGAHGVLGKPFEGDELVRALHDAVACRADVSSATSSAATAIVDSAREIAPILDIEALEGPESIFRTVDPAELMIAFTRDIEKNKGLLKQAAATADLVLFRSSIHSLTGYAGTLGARRLQWLLATAPRDAAGLRANGSMAVVELGETMNATASALDAWSKAFVCVAQ